MTNVVCTAALAFAIAAGAMSTASAAPTIERVWSWNLSTTSAGLSMVVGPSTTPTDVHFLIGELPTFNDARKVGESKLPATTTGVGSNYQLQGLKPGTHYYFKAIAVNGGSAEMQGDFSTVAGVPPTVAMPAVQYVTQTGAIVTAPVSSVINGKSVVSYATQSTFANAIQVTNPTQAGTDPDTVDLTNKLQPGTTYYVKAVATTPYGSGTSPVLTFTTATAVVVLAAPAMGNTWSWNVGKNSAGLSMLLQTNGVSGMAYFVYGTNPALTSGTSSTYKSAIPAVTTGIGSNITVNGLASATTYYYQAIFTSLSGTIKSPIATFQTTN